MSDGDRRSSRASSSTGSSSSFSPAISGFYGADAETAKHVVMLVNDVRQVGGDHVYKPFIRLLKDCAAGRITRKKLIVCVHDLLVEHPFLLSRFCKLVPPALVEESEHSDKQGSRPHRGSRRSKASKDQEVVISLEMEGSRTISTVEEADESKAGRERKLFGGIKKWPGTRRTISEEAHPSTGPLWMRPWAVAHQWMRNHKVSDDPSASLQERA
ncbi:hypothetical protein COCSUDRAFT_66526 [Coccomyxa subellipsoidea C-169]|uniref:Uncharacterized protein n=1 Tax=Coccomyxa subellipsoidea (strain C-169) TaxID=574566 RepID=I0YV33_COCSC|nr:hypothetical protein COCSUDRAFT_66526 [Coccomyxa subellipsoidea C-169]EIE22252.1 hypothetical protein COCSUDRAFT_66526 [Coccomyxa subellipsoidea C-169]|eukprot:XP_005646796.1 hypothetical protein COCSUDRAFT_66526 [Coccomyxa subellipsoidea C-169]